MFRNITTAFGLAAVVTMAPMAAYAQATKTGDDAIEDRIEYRLEVNDTLHKYNLSADVNAGVATLKGDVATAAQRSEAERLAKVDGVTRVVNEIKVDANADRTLAERTKSGLNKAGDKITDAWITTKVNWFFMGEDALKGSDINVDTKDNTVTLKGTVASAAGRTRAVALARRAEGVKNVVDQLTIKPAR